MVMPRYWPVVAAALGALACSGKYEVGAMMADPYQSGSGGTVSSAGSSTGPVRPTGTSGTDVGGAAVTETDLTSCVPAGMPQPLTGAFVEPDLVAQRLAPLLGGAEVEPLPERSSSAWAGAVVDQYWYNASLAMSQAAFVAAWFGWDGDPVSQVLINRLVSDTPALQALLLTSTSEQRVGIFNERGFLRTYPTLSARGRAMIRALFAEEVPTPPAAGAVEHIDQPLDDAPGLSNRERLEASLDAARCTPCHAIFDPLGVSLEQFDELGEFRGAAVDSAGSFRIPRSDSTIEFTDSRTLGEQLAPTCSANLAFAAQFLRGALRVPARSPEEREAAYEASLARVQQGFIRGGMTYRALVRAYAQSPAVLEP